MVNKIQDGISLTGNRAGTVEGHVGSFNRIGYV